jgi:hypothetical protein
MYGKLLITAVFAPMFSLAQNVGIGTTTPTARLHVVDSSANVFRLWMQAPTLATSETRLELTAGTNPFSALFLTKYAPGATGTLAGVSKDNLSALSTGGNAGALLLSTGDGTSPLLFATGTGERMRINADGKVGIGTTTPSAQNNLHVHNSASLSGIDVSIGITNSLTTDANGRGARFRMNGYDLLIANNEPTGRLSLSTNLNQRLVITPTGNIGINNLNPAYLLDIEANSGSRAVNINQTGSNSNGLRVTSTPGNINNTGVFVSNPTNSSLPNNYAAGIHTITGTGAAFSFSPTVNYGLIAECRNTERGYGVLGISHSPSPQLIEAAVVGANYSSAPFSYGVIGSSTGSSGAGTVGYTDNFTAGLLGYASPFSIGPAIKSVSEPGSSAIGLELENGAIKVSGANRSVFRHTCTAGNTASNETIIPNTTLARNANDLLIVTPFWDGTYVNAPIGVYFESASATWRIFRQDLGLMPLNAKFNVMVIKQ